MKTLTILLFSLLLSPAFAQEKPVQVVIIVKAGYVTTANNWLKTKFGATGSNLSVPLILKSDPDTQSPRAYGCNWECFKPSHFDVTKSDLETVQNQIQADRVRIWKNKSFDSCLTLLNLRIKPSPKLQ